MIFNKKEIIDTSHINVKLKPILNIKPQTYILALFFSFILIFLLCLFFLPSIMRNGSELYITSTPDNGTIYIDDVRVGTTPLNIAVKTGDHVVTVTRGDFNPITSNITVGFQSIFNRKTTKHFTLTSQNGEKILTDSYNEMAHWSLINSNDVTNRYRLPFLLSSSVKDYYRSADFNRKTIDDYLLSSTKLITNQNIFSDYLRALAIYKSDCKMLSLSSITNSVNFISNIINDNPNTPLLIYNNIVKDIDTNDEYYTILTDRHRNVINKSAISFQDSKSDTEIGNMTFKYVPQSSITPSDVNFIHNILVEEFYISEFMVTKEDYLTFTFNNPMWALDNKNELIANDLVDDYYLTFENSEDYITHISYYAAAAWCEWANEYYDLSEGWVIKLPTENMWFSANLYGAALNIDAWQWTDQGFYLYEHFLTDSSGLPIEPFTEITPRLVVGKNKYNTKAESGRGVQEATWCTPFLSFRPVLVKE